ncbi:MAG: copper chaperone PCu(A)C [Acidiferrobacterales bacterium]
MKFVTGLLSVFLLVSGMLVHAGGFEVEGPWIREAPPGMKMLSGYMRLENEKDAALNLAGATSSDFGSIDIHHTVFKDGLASMVLLQSLKIPAFSTVKFEPNGLHLMLANPKRELKAGDKVRITLKFSNSRRLKVVFPVRKSGAAPR